MNINKFKLCFLSSVLWLTTEGWSQGMTTNSGAKIVIANGASVVISGNLNNSGINTTLTNNGTLITDGSILNTSNATVQGNGIYKVGGDWSNAATFIAGTSTVELVGNNAATITSGNNSFYNLILNKGTTNSIVSFLINATSVTNNLTFTGANNKLHLDNLNLTISNPIVGYDATKYIITDGTGKLISSLVGATAFTFPIGFSLASYTPLSISQTGTPLSLGLRIQDQVFDKGTGGTVLTSGIVNKSWVVTEESVPVKKNLNLVAQWNGTEELNGLDITKCGISAWNTTNTAWDLTWADVGARTGANPYTRTRSNILEVGTFAVGSKPVATYVLLSARVFLQGAYAGSGLMNEGLRSATLIPAAENTAAPSGQMPRPNGYAHQAWGGSEAAGVNAFNSQPSTNDNIVDWVFVELRDPSVSNTILHTRAALLQRDGDIVNEDGSSPLKIYGVPDGNYYISIRHRNHLAVRTATTKSLSQALRTSVDFTTLLTEALATPVGSAYNAMATLSDGKYALWGGNVNSDAAARRSGPASVNDASLLTTYLGSSTSIPSVYRREDVNMNGNVARSGPASVNDASRLSSYLGINTLITQPTF
jgi:hypothetical protein